MSSGDGSYWMYFQSKSRQEFVTNATSWAQSTGGTLYCLVAVSKDHLPNLLAQHRKLVRRGSLQIRLTQNAESLWLLEIRRSTTTGKAPHVRGRAALIQHDRQGVYLFVTHEGQEFLRLALRPLVGGLFPKASAASYKSDDLRQTLSRLQERRGGLILSRRLVATSKLVGEYTRRMKESDVKYTDESFESSFQKARLNEQYVSLIDFDYYSEHPENAGSEVWEQEATFHGHISRYGALRCRGNFELFYREIVNPMARRASEYLGFFGKRSRRETPAHRPRPIVISYDSDVLVEPEQLRRLVQSLHELPFSSASVLHGNPYLHVSVLDYRDGSACEIWVTSPDKITIVPQLRSSYSFLDRLTSHIFETLKEGELEEYLAAVPA